jgi:hypothetical protein
MISLMGKIICQNCGHPPHEGITCPVVEVHLEDVREPCECVEFIPIDEEELRDVPAAP